MDRELVSTSTSTPTATTTDLMSDDDAARDNTSEVAEVFLPRIVDEYPRGTAAEALVDLWQSDRPVACAAVVVAQSDPAGRAVEAEVEAAPPPRPRKSQRTHVPRCRHLCDEPAQVARTTVAVDAPQDDAVDGAAAAAMMDVAAEVEAAPPPRPRKSQRSHCPLRRHLGDEPAQVALEPARVTRTAVAVNEPQGDPARLRRRAIARAAKLHKFSHLAAPHLRNKAHVLVHLKGIAALEALEVSVELPGSDVAVSWVEGLLTNHQDHRLQL